MLDTIIMEIVIHSWLITGFVTRLSRRVPLVEQELLTLSEHLSSPPVLSGVRVTRSLVLYVCFVARCLFLLSFFFWSLCCIFFINIRILITPLVSSNSFYITCNLEVYWYHIAELYFTIKLRILQVVTLGTCHSAIFTYSWHIIWYSRPPSTTSKVTTCKDKNIKAYNL